MKLRQSVLISFHDFRTWKKNNTNGVKDSVIFFTNQYLIYIVIVAKYRGFAVRLTDFRAVSQACGKISWTQPNLTKFSLQTAILAVFMDFFVNFIPGKSVSANLENVIFKILWGSIPPDPPRIGLKKFLATARLEKSFMLVWLTKFYLSFNASLIERY